MSHLSPSGIRKHDFATSRRYSPGDLRGLTGAARVARWANVVASDGVLGSVDANEKGAHAQDADHHAGLE